jgi:hypothetical protein
MKPNLSELNL